MTQIAAASAHDRAAMRVERMRRSRWDPGGLCGRQRVSDRGAGADRVRLSPAGWSSGRRAEGLERRQFDGVEQGDRVTSESLCRSANASIRGAACLCGSVECAAGV